MADSSKDTTEAGAASAKAEDLRLQGNDAFKTQDYERALKLYKASVAATSDTPATSKTYSNLAATLSKLGKYEEACKAAERATVLDPKWGKGWWRRGTCLELTKDFARAKNCYKIAVQLEPKQKEFKKALRQIDKRLGVESTLDNGFSVVPPNVTNQIPVSVKAFRRANAMLGRGSYLSMTHRFMMILNHDAKNPTSFEWLFHGFIQWIGGVKGAVAEFAKSTSPQSGIAWTQLSNQTSRFGSQDDYLLEVERVLGGFPDSNSMDNSLSGFTHLGGMHTFMNMGLEGPPGITPPVFTPPLHLPNPAYQLMGVLWSIFIPLSDLVKNRGFGRNIKISKGILVAVELLFANMGGAPRGLLDIKDMKQDPSPKEMVDYVKKQLRAGKTWDSAMRRFVALNYRATVLFAGVYRLVMPALLADSYRFEKWANDFITLLDREFKVTATESFREKGTAFRPSIRVGSLMSQLMSLETLRCDQINGPYSMEMTLDLCVDIVEMAERVDPKNMGRTDEYLRVQDEVAFRRKPLALAHGAIASHLNRLSALFSLDDFEGIVMHHGLYPDDAEVVVDPFALIAKHYLIAAENELPDAADGATYWWGAAAAMARTQKFSGYTLGQLRNAIRKAEEAQRARDVGLFGENPLVGGSLETLAKIVARHYDQESDDFVIPQVNLKPPEAGGASTAYLEVEGKVICQDWEKVERGDHEMYDKKNQKHRDLMNTSDVQKEHGQFQQGIPSLETLCIRELHKGGHEFAKGHTDGAEIIYNAMMSESKMDEG